MKKLLFACSLILLNGFASAARAESTDDSAAEETRQKKALLQEILSDSPIRAEQPTARVPEKPAVVAPATLSGRVEAKAEDPRPRTRPSGAQEGIGTSVASISLWPLVLLALMLGGALWWTKRLQQPRLQAAPIQKLAIIQLGGKRSLAVVEVMGRKLVLGLSEKSVNLLTCIEDDGVGPSVSRRSPRVEEEPFEEDLQNLLDPRDRGDRVRVKGTISERDELARKFRSLGSA